MPDDTFDPRGLQPVASLEELVGEDEAGEPLSWEELLGTDENDPEREYAVKEAFERMSQDLKDTAAMIADGWTEQELADHLGITRQAVNARVHRIREALGQ